MGAAKVTASTARARHPMRCNGPNVIGEDALSHNPSPPLVVVRIGRHPAIGGGRAGEVGICASTAHRAPRFEVHIEDLCYLPRRIWGNWRNLTSLGSITRAYLDVCRGGL